MGALRELYQEVILDHNRTPRNFRKIESADEFEGYNPLCGDHYTIYLQMDGEVIRDISFQGAGCAISKASASVMTATVKGKTRPEAEAFFTTFHDMVMGESRLDPESLGRLGAFSGVKEFPSRIKCAVLAWHTLNNALHGQREVVKTE